MQIYFEYLPSGISIGINDTNEIPMASLIKVPTIIGIYRKINAKEIEKTEMLTIQEDDIDTHFGELWKKGAGATISVEDAIKLTITQSDNTAHSVLYKKLSDSEKYQVYGELDIRIEKNKEDILPIISAKSYSSILKSLYYSSYLPASYSEEILTYMIESIDKEKLVAGIDSTIPVAHKIGVYEKVGGNFVYSDCGIIYLPKRQYILCMMIEDSSHEKSTTIMAHLSKIVNSYITSIKNE